MFVGPHDAERVAAGEDEDGGGVGGADGAEHFFLGGGQVEIGAVFGFASVDEGVVAGDDDGDFGGGGDGGGFGGAGAEVSMAKTAALSASGVRVTVLLPPTAT